MLQYSISARIRYVVKLSNMVSWGAHAFSWYARLVFKPTSRSAAALHKDIKATRAKPTDAGPPAHMRAKFCIKETAVGRSAVYTISLPSEQDCQARILYIHGGSFLFEITPTHWSAVAALAEHLRATVTVPIYPLGPEHKMEDIHKMMWPVYDDLAGAQDQTPLHIVGDSAGATLALVMTQEAIRQAKPVADALVLISPLLDATLSNAEAHVVAKTDPWLDVPGVLETVELIRGEWLVDDPRISPMFGQISGLPPILLFAAEKDLLCPDTKRFAQKVKASDVDITLVEGKGLMHVWPILPFSEGRQAFAQMVKWLKKQKNTAA